MATTPTYDLTTPVSDITNQIKGSGLVVLAVVAAWRVFKVAKRMIRAAG